MREIPQIHDVGHQQAKQDKRLAPLGGVAPKCPDILDDQRPGIRPAPPEPLGQAIEQLGLKRRLAKRLAGAGTASPKLPSPAAATTIDRRERGEKQAARLGRRQIAKEKRVTEQNQPEEKRPHQSTLNPKREPARHPKTGQVREQRKPRPRQQPVDHVEHAGLEHLVGHRLRLQPRTDRHDDKHDHQHRRDLERKPIQPTRQTQCRPTPQHTRQHNEQSHKHRRWR